MSGDTSIILYLGIFLTSVIMFRIAISFVHRIKAYFDRRMVKNLMKKKTSTVFAQEKFDEELKLSDVFSVYYEDDGEIKLEHSSKKIHFLSANQHGNSNTISVSTSTLVFVNFHCNPHKLILI